MRFETDFVYDDRKGKAKYVYLKYRSILTGKILDVGSDSCYLREHLTDDVSYRGIGFDSKESDPIDLEKIPLPFSENEFDCVLCLDVLEHLDDIHAVFDELCRITQSQIAIQQVKEYVQP